MTRVRLDDLTSAHLDELYDRLEAAEDAVARTHQLASRWTVLRAYGSAAAELRATLVGPTDTRPDTSGDTADTRRDTVRTRRADEAGRDDGTPLTSADTVRIRPGADTPDSVRTVDVIRVRRGQVRAAIGAAFDVPTGLITSEPLC